MGERMKEYWQQRASSLTTRSLSLRIASSDPGKKMRSPSKDPKPSPLPVTGRQALLKEDQIGAVQLEEYLRTAFPFKIPSREEKLLLRTSAPIQFQPHLHPHHCPTPFHVMPWAEASKLAKGHPSAESSHCHSCHLAINLHIHPAYPASDLVLVHKEDRWWRPPPVDPQQQQQPQTTGSNAYSEILLRHPALPTNAILFGARWKELERAWADQLNWRANRVKFPKLISFPDMVKLPTKNFATRFYHPCFSCFHQRFSYASVDWIVPSASLDINHFRLLERILGVKQPR